MTDGRDSLLSVLSRVPGIRVMWDSERKQECLVLNVAYRWTVRLSPWRSS